VKSRAQRFLGGGFNGLVDGVRQQFLGRILQESAAPRHPDPSVGRLQLSLAIAIAKRDTHAQLWQMCMREEVLLPVDQVRTLICGWLKIALRVRQTLAAMDIADSTTVH
jgi:hypothetical protein